jgi:HK97 family phage portal protein
MMTWRGVASRVGRWLNSYGDLEERAFADRLRQGNVSGVIVTEHSALWQSAVWGCVRVISESLAMLPIDVIEKRGKRREMLSEHPVSWLLNTSPDGLMPSFRFRETLIAHALTWGNGYAEIERDTVGRPYGLHLVTPDRVEPTRIDGQVVYDYQQADGTKVRIDGRDMLHVPGLGWDGLKGYSVVAMAGQSLGLNAALETFAAAFFGNGMQLGTTYTTDKDLKLDQVEQIRKSLEKVHRGPAKAHTAAILTSGLKPADPPMPLKEAQFIEGRRFGVLEICRWFRVPPHLVMELERATHANIEQEQLAFVTHCLQPWATRIEAECNLKLLGRNQQSRQSVKHNFGALVRGDMQSRYGAYKVAREAGFLSVNEIRELEERNGIGEDGDIYLVPANMTTPEKLLQPDPAPAPPAPPPTDPESDPEDDSPLESARAHMRLVRSSNAHA